MEKHRTTQSTDKVEKLTAPDEKPLQSWKEIAAYLERDERTTRRWEQNAGLPIRRHGEVSHETSIWVMEGLIPGTGTMEQKD